MLSFSPCLFSKSYHISNDFSYVFREDLFLTSYVRCSFYHPNLVLPALTKTLENLSTSYLDLYLLELPRLHILPYTLIPNRKAKMVQFDDVIKTWKAMEEAVDAGLVKNIGLAHFSGAQVKQLLKEARIKPVVNIIECDAYVPQKLFTKFLKCVDILPVVTGFYGNWREIR